MNEKQDRLDELKKMTRLELLRTVTRNQEKIEQLSQENELLEKELDEKKSLLAQNQDAAHAALALNQVYEAAQAAAELYLYTIETQFAASPDQASDQTASPAGKVISEDAEEAAKDPADRGQ